MTPASKARWAAVKGDLHGATVTMWHAIQGCVPGLYHGLADSIWQQLDCHQWGALIKNRDGSYATGDTYGLESWRIPLAGPGVGEYWRTECLNLINKDGEGSGVNFPGSLDLPPIPDNLA